MAEILEGKVLATAPVMGESGPEGLLLQIEWGDSDVVEWTILRGAPALALLATPGPAVKRARVARGAAGMPSGAVNGVSTKCLKCNKCGKEYTHSGNATKHVRTVHKGKASMVPC